MFSSETREEAICRLYALGHSIHTIRELTGIRYEQVKYITEYYEQKYVAPLPIKMGKPSKIDNSILSKIETFT